MKKYETGRIYKITNDVNDLIYIGSTTQTLSRRMAGHRKRAKIGCTSCIYKAMWDIGIDHFICVLLREVTDVNKEHLRAYENGYITRLDTVKNGYNGRYEVGHICEHERQRTHCKDCSGSFCEHGKQRSKCKECGGGSVCVHKRIRSKCKECGGGSFCEHKRMRRQCKECGGGGICIHGRQPYHCKDCGGPQMCEHNRLRTQCKDCNNFLCELCDKKLCSVRSLNRHFQSKAHLKRVVQLGRSTPISPI
jgi:hypothetical protein